MNIYIVEGHTNYEGFEIVSIHASRENAQAKVDSAKKDIDGDIIFRLARDNARLTADTLIDIDDHSPLNFCHTQFLRRPLTASGASMLSRQSRARSSYPPELS